jgi:hypothetical protein
MLPVVSLEMHHVASAFAFISVSLLWLWSVFGLKALQNQRLSGHLPLERRRKRAAAVSYLAALSICTLMAFTPAKDALSLRLWSGLSIASPLLHAWLDPLKSGYLHHGKVRYLAFLGLFTLLAGLTLYAPLPAATPLVFAALVFHRHQRATMRHFAETLAEQAALSTKIIDLNAKLETSRRHAAPLLDQASQGSDDASDLLHDNLPKAG